MKTKFLSYIAAAVALLGFSACSDSWVADTDGRGEGRLDTSTIIASVKNYDEIVITDNKGVDKAPSRAVTYLDSYLVTIIDKNGDEVEKWTLGSMPSMPTFPVGNYKVKVESHKVTPADWETPYFYGEESFQITDGGIAVVPQIVCTLQNIRVSILFHSDLLKKAGDDLKVTVTSKPGTEMEFTPAETRSAYFQYIEGLSTLKVTFTGTVAGTAENTTAVLTEVAPGQHRKVTIGMKGNNNKPDDEIGNIQVDNEGVNVDFSVEETDLAGDINPGGEEVITPGYNPGHEQQPDDPGQDPGDDPNPPAPPTGDEISFTSEYLDLNGANNADDYGLEDGQKPAAVHIASPKGFKSLVVDIESEFLTEDMLSSVGFTSHFDLANPATDDLAAALSGFQFPVRDEITADGVTDLDFDITPFVGLLFEAGDHKFHITAVDKEGNSKMMTLLIRKS